MIIIYLESCYNNGQCLRFNIRPHGSSPRPGPEVPIEYAPHIIAALTDLLLNNNHK